MMVTVHSCQIESFSNEVHLDVDSVAFDNTGQFLSIVSEQDWEIQVYSVSSTEMADSWFTVTPSTGSGSKSNIALTYTKNTTAVARKVSIAVIFPDETVTVIFTQGGKTGGGEGGGGSSDKLVSDKVGKWMELPVVDTTATCGYISHYATISNKSVRNYSMLYDGANRIALWVAYPLCSTYIGSQGRSDAWSYDPKIPKDMQPALFSAYGSNGYEGYDRGHQLPSASRTANYSTNAATFYFSNMTPQNSSLNQGVWAKLETKVRGYSSTCDTLYVITGPVLKTTEDPVITYIQDREQNNIALPKAYFKVLLKYTKSSNKYQAIGFWYKNQSYGYDTPSSADAQTVKWIEDKTGYTFFTNLPSDIASTVKNEFKPSEWGL